MTAVAFNVPSEGPRRRGSFPRAVSNQLHVIGALILRELHTRFGRENIGYLWVIAEPMLLALAVSSMHAGSSLHFGLEMQPIPFALDGYCLFMIFRSIITRSESTLLANQPLLYHRMVTIFDMLLARAILEMASTLSAFVILLFAAWALGYADLPADPLLFLASVFLMTWFSFALSMLVCAGTHGSHLFARLLHPIVYILMPISGTFFLLRWIPNPYRDWLAWFPMTQIFEMSRVGLFEGFQSPYYDGAYIAAWCLVLTWLGLIAIRITRRHIHLH